MLWIHSKTEGKSMHKTFRVVCGAIEVPGPAGTTHWQPLYRDMQVMIDDNPEPPEGNTSAPTKDKS